MRPHRLLSRSLLVLPLLGSCGLLPAGDTRIPTIIHRTVAPGDVLRVRDLDTPEPPLAVMSVDAFGEVAVDDFGTTLSVSGYTAEDVEAVLASFSDQPDRRLAVEILPPRSRIWLYGEVGRGGRRVLRPGTTLTEAVAAAEPTPGRADLERVHVLRGPAGSIELVVDMVAARTDASLDVLLMDGDVLVVLPEGARSGTAHLD